MQRNDDLNTNPEFSINPDINDIVTIQKSIRGFLDRRKYRIQELQNYQLESYKTFVVGNDPYMPNELNNYHNDNEKISLVATSGMRAVSLACKLGNQANTPKIILIDNSSQVCEFWQLLRDFIEDDTKAGTARLFMNNLVHFLKQHEDLYRQIPATAYKRNGDVKYLNQDIRVYFYSLIKKYNYKYVRDVIKHTSIIKQSWADPQVFVKVKNILSYLGINQIYMYPSNIVSCIDDKYTRNQILKNIEKMTPTLAIHTNDGEFGYPDKVFLLKNNNAHAAKQVLFPPDAQHNPRTVQLDLNTLINLLMASNQTPTPIFQNGFRYLK